MEKKKLLLVAISVGVFLVLTIGAAILVFSPKSANLPFESVANNDNPETFDVIPPSPFQTIAAVSEQEIAQPSSIDAIDLVRNPEGVPGLVPPTEGIYSQFYEVERSTENVISVTQPTTAAVPTTAPTGRAANQSTPAAATRPTQTTTTPAQTTTSPSQTASTSTRTTTTPSQTTSAPAQTNTSPSQTASTSTRTTTTPSQTASAPAQTTTSPSQTASAPAQTTTSPSQTASAPAQTTTSPSQTDSTPAQTTTSPSQTASAPAQTTTSPSQTASASTQTTTSPSQMASTPTQATGAPAQTASTPPPVTITPASVATTGSQSIPAVQTGIYSDFWVQTGAFSTMASAENVKETLATKGITSIIENGIINGRSLFRVRVGPYTSRNEANYWLALIQSMDGFEDSQVRTTDNLQ